MVFGKYINEYYKKYFFAFLIGFIALIAVDYAQLLIPEYLGTAIDNISNGVSPSFYLKETVIKIIIVACVMFCGRFLWRITLFQVATKVQSDLRKKIFYKSTTLSRNDFQKNKVGSLLSLMTYDIETIQDVLGFGLMMFVDFAFLGGLTIYKMIRLDWRLTLFSVIPMILIAVLGGIVEKWMSYFYEKRQEKLDNLSNFAQENFSGIRVIKAFVQEGFEKAEAKRLGKECKKSEENLTKFSSGVESIISFLCSTVIVLILGVGGYYIYLNAVGQMDSALSSGSVITFVGYFDTLVWPMMAFGQIIVMTSKAKSSLNRISKVLDLKQDLKDGSDSFKEDVKGVIEFKDFSFRYENEGNDVLKNINLKINQGERIGIVGKIGSGKTTIADILVRLYNVKENSVFIDDKDIMSLKIEEVRKAIAYVPQDSILFSDTIRNNIAFADENASLDKIKFSAAFASVDKNIDSFEKQYETVLGEKGVSISGGQKQRVAIARAFLKDAPIMILDDSVSAVDVKTEKTILENILKYRENKTTILIASRVSTVEHLDKILVLNDGRIEAFGTHETLLKSSEMYKKMVHIQKFEDQLNGECYE